MNRTLKQVAKKLAQLTVGTLPPPASRLTGKLARDGGKPVRDIRFRPWADYHAGNLLAWLTTIGPQFRQIFVSGVEGVPQPLARKFAEQWAEYCGCRYGLLMAHGTDALRFGLAAALDHDGLDYGGEVIVPNFSFIASATVPLDRRFGIALVDVDPDTLLLDPQRVEEAIVPGRTRAILPVHLFGQPADMTSLMAIARRHGLKVIEDAAQAHGAVWESDPAGSLGDAAGFSFQSFKNLTSGEGGALTTNSEEIFERAYSMHNTGRSRTNTGRWDHVALGWNCRPTEYQAALLLYRFAKFETQQARRERNFARLRELLLQENITCLKPLTVHPAVKQHGMHMFAVRYQPENCGGIPFEEFLTIVQGEGAPIHRAYACSIAQQPAIAQLAERHPEYFRVLATPVAEQAANDTAYIPHHVFLGSETDMRDIADAIRKVQSHFQQTSGTWSQQQTIESPVAVGDARLVP